MPSDRSVHPSLDQLTAFALGQASEETAVELSRHLADCSECRTAVDALPDDGLLSLLRQRLEPDTNQDVHEAATTAGPAATVPGAGSIPSSLAAHERYRVLELLGSGGMGAVYKAEHRRMERHVALKVMSPDLMDRPQMVERFHREVKAAALLTHPNIVTAYDADQAGDTHFLIMEFVEGISLAQKVQQAGPLPIARACDYVRQAALGLQHAFERGMVHRDVKPHNLMLTPTGQVKILDFGLARFVRETASVRAETSAPTTETAGPASVGAASALTETGMVMGTVDFIAPEQATDPSRADVRADIYSLGCTLYYLLAGHAPFPEGAALDKLTAHCERAPAPLTDLRRDVPPALARVVERMMAKDPAQRYQTPAAVAEALTPFLAETPPRRRARRLAVAAAVCALALLAATVIYVKTDKGELVIQTEDPDVEVLVSQNGNLVKIIDLKTKATVELRSGDYEIALKGGKDLKLSTNSFSLKRGGKEIVKVEQRVAGPGTGKIRRPSARGEPIAPKYREAINKGLDYLAKAQRIDGHWTAIGDQYPTSITALAGMALLMEGSTLHDGKYADSLRKAVDWMMERSQDNGLLELPNHAEAGRYLFGHAHGTLFLATVYSQEEEGDRRTKLETILNKAVEFSGKAQTIGGGWGYVAAADGGGFDEGAVTIVQMQGLRAARNAGIVVPKRLINVDYLRKSTTPKGGLIYSLSMGGGGERPALTVAALAGMLTTGEFDSDFARKWLTYCQQTIPLAKPDAKIGHDEYVHYYYAQALYALGDKGYEKLFPDSKPSEQLTWSKYRETMFDYLLSRQREDGSWDLGVLGPVYSTACCLTILQLDNATLQIYQR
jgi:tRNA A-37 threonylcarbamoyl transferase component Bud32/anti-sigma factor RsiW